MNRAPLPDRNDKMSSWESLAALAVLGAIVLAFLYGLGWIIKWTISP